MIGLFRTALSRINPKKALSWRKTRAQSRLLMTSRGTDQPRSEPALESVSVLMTFKVDNDDRASVLDLVLDRLGKDLAGSDIPLHISDASPDRYASLARSKAATVSRTVNYRRSEKPMSLSYADLLEGCPTPYCYLQFDDQITTNLSSDYLLAACSFLDRYSRYVPLVSAVWPLEVKVDDDRHQVRVLTHRRKESAFGRGESYKFAYHRPRRPLFIEEIDGLRFGVFENFYYGFYFNHIVTRADDYSRRLHWYLEALDSVSVHEIELAAKDRTLGPFWTHIAVCLDGMALLDLDYSHTASSVRPVASTARDVHRALSQGYGIRAVHTDVDQAPAGE